MGTAKILLQITTTLNRYITIPHISFHHMSKLKITIKEYLQISFKIRKILIDSILSLSEMTILHDSQPINKSTSIYKRIKITQRKAKR